MRADKAWRVVIMAMIMALVAGACGGGTADEGTGSAGGPTELNVAAVFESPLEDGWNTSFAQSWDRVKQEKPHGLTINVENSDNIALADGERVLRQLAQSGRYQMIVAHSSYGDAVKVLKDEFPDIMWVFSGSGNEGLGGNAYWLDCYTHESTYLMGIIAGMMTKTDVIGTVGAFAFPNVNAYLNGYTAGAKSVNPDVRVKSAYVESWFDPPKAKEAASAQISAGADFIYAESFGVFEAAQEKSGTLVFGHYVDQSRLAPDIVVTSDLCLWDTAVKLLVDTWWDHETKGTPYNASKERIVFLMKDGGTDIAPYNQLESSIPQEVKDAVAKARADILADTLKVEFNTNELKSE